MKRMKVLICTCGLILVSLYYAMAFELMASIFISLGLSASFSTLRLGKEIHWIGDSHIKDIVYK